MKPTTLFFCFLLFPYLNLLAQIPDLPLSFTNEEVREFKENITYCMLPYIDIESELKSKHEIMRNIITGLGRKVNIDVIGQAKKYNLDNGSIYIYKMESEDAVSIQLFYDYFFLAEGAYLHLYNEDKKIFMEPLTSKDNNPDFSKIGERVHGDQITLEFFEPNTTKTKSKIVIHSVMYGVSPNIQNKIAKTDCFVCKILRGIGLKNYVMTF